MRKPLAWGAAASERYLNGTVIGPGSRYNRHRPHRSLSLQPPEGRSAVPVRAPKLDIHRHEVLGGLLNEYKAAA